MVLLSWERYNYDYENVQLIAIHYTLIYSFPFNKTCAIHSGREV